jgi:hypothetical protein
MYFQLFNRIRIVISWLGALGISSSIVLPAYCQPNSIRLDFPSLGSTTKDLPPIRFTPGMRNRDSTDTYPYGSRISRSGLISTPRGEENLLKCGWRKEIEWKLPSEEALFKDSKIMVNRVEARTRCAIPLSIYLTALVPQTDISITGSEYPTFFFYIPDVNLELVDAAKLFLMNSDEEVVYQKEVKLNSPDKVVSIDFYNSPGLPPLKIGEPYYWVFFITFREDIRMASGTSVSGWIKRVSLNSKLQHELDTALAQEKPAIYASNGFWHDALTSLAKLRCSYPNDATYRSDWESLLQQVELPKIATKPLAQCN